MEKMDWLDLENAASTLLIGYLDKADLNCTQCIWKLLENDELTTYKNEIDKNKVLVLFLALIEFVNDCTSLIREDNFELEIIVWAEEVSINPFRIAQLVGADFESADDNDGEELFRSALFELLAECRNLIVESIERKYPDSLKVMEFIGEFYEPASDQPPVSEEYIEEHINEASIPINVMKFFSWVDEGMERRN